MRRNLTSGKVSLPNAREPSRCRLVSVRLGMVLIVLAGGSVSHTVHALGSERGLHLSRWWIEPTLETGVFFDSNPNASSDGEGSSSGFYVAPNIEGKSDFSRHEVNFSAGGQHSGYFDDIASRSNIFGSLDTRLDIKRDFVLRSGVRGGYFEDRQADAKALFEAPPGDLVTPIGAAEPVTYATLDAWSSLEKSFNRLFVAADVAYHTADYHDVKAIGGGTLDQDFRNGNSFVVGGRAGYLISPGYSVFVDGHYNDRRYDTGLNDSTGWSALGGVQFELTHLLSGEISAGYMQQDFDTGTTVSGASYHAGLVWNATMLMTVRLDANRYIGESDIAGSPGTVADSLAAALDYEVLRTLVVSPFVGIALQGYISSPIEAQSLYAGLAADYEINRFVSVGVDYRVEDVNYSSSGSDYNRHVVGVNASAHF